MNKTLTIDTTNMCSHLQKKLFEEEGSSRWSLAEMPLHLTSGGLRIYLKPFMYIRVVTDAYLSLSLRPVVSCCLTRETREFHRWNS